MKRVFTILATLVFTVSLWAQSPAKMSYQAVIRNSTNQLVVSHQVGMKISILQGTSTGNSVYTEIYNPNPATNASGLVSIEIGGGIPLSGTFASINWSMGPYFIKTETDPTGGTTYSITGTSQLLSVPYALHAKTAESVAAGTVAGQMQYWNGSAWVNIAPGKENQSLKLKNGVPTWSDENINYLAIGDYYQGGTIAYFLMPGDPGYDASTKHGLIAATTDQSTALPWHNGNNIVTGAVATAIGTGLANTNTIIAVQGATSINYAAGLARAYQGGGYTDWFLPSKDELNQLYINRQIIGNFRAAYYWSSSEASASDAFLQAFDRNFVGDYQYKSSMLSVRAVRAF